MEYSGYQKTVNEAEADHLRVMRTLIHDLRKSKMSLRNFIQNQSTCIDLLSHSQYSWKREYTYLVLQIDRLNTGSTIAGNPALTEDETLKIERLIKGMEFILTMAEKKN